MISVARENEKLQGFIFPFPTQDEYYIWDQMQLQTMRDRSADMDTTNASHPF